jgi:hypothetical protein
MKRVLGGLRARARVVLAVAAVLLLAASWQIAGSRRVASKGGSRARASVDATVAMNSAGTTTSSGARAASPISTTAVVQDVAPSNLPIAGKGMWIWLFPQVEGGNPQRIVAKARALGLTHIFVRSSSTTDGLKYLGDIDRIVPIAHAAGIKVIAWDFVMLRNPEADARRIVTVLDHRIPGNQSVDGIAVDLETPSEGVHLTPQRAEYLSVRLQQLRPKRFRLLVPPRPSPWTLKFYPYGIITHYNAVAPMDYWIDVDPVALVRNTMAYLKRFGKPIAPIGQAYDGSAEGGPPGAPSGRLLTWFASAAQQAGAVGVSFWSWQHATGDEFDAIARMRFPVPAR